MAYRRNRNPFEDEDQDRFEDINPESSEVDRIKQEKDLIQQRMIDSSYRSVGLINESQGIASETGLELQKQKEQLQRTNKNLDKISGELDQSDRNITSLKSIWGTMSNWFKKPIKQDTSESSSNGSTNTQDVLKVNQELRKDNNEIQGNLRKINQKTDLSWDDGHASSTYTRQSGSVDDIVDKNLDHMLAGLDILRGQGLALSKELDDHNELLDNIQSKVDKADVRIEDQNLKMRKILK